MMLHLTDVERLLTASLPVIHNATNQYLAEARNIAIREARGRYILPLDADDKIAPTTVQTLADALDIDRLLDVAYGNVLFTKENGQLEDYGIQGRSLGHSGWPVPWEPSSQLSGYNLLPYCSMFRQHAWHNVGDIVAGCTHLRMQISGHG
jgi:glycosyltransferase involved in cell wall biosynthesis